MDIVERLLNTRTPGAEALCVEAAHTISRLREENAELRAFKERCEGQKQAKLNFPSMLRKMWSGGEVQQWIDEQGPLFRHPVAPEGYKLVPIEPTDEMIEAGADSMSWQNYCDDAKRTYKAMLSAAPEE